MTKVGRNEPCPCGSGSKYKRCCLGKEDSGDPEPEDHDARRMVAFVEPLLPKGSLRPADVETAMSFGIVCWRLALTENDTAREERLVEAVDAFKAAAGEVPDDAIVAFREMAEMMVERHRRMFPEMHPRSIVSLD